jgi:hypothetical protein
LRLSPLIVRTASSPAYRDYQARLFVSSKISNSASQCLSTENAGHGRLRFLEQFVVEAPERGVSQVAIICEVHKLDADAVPVVSKMAREGSSNSCFANIPPVIEAQVEFISDLISRAQRSGAVVEPTEEAESYWEDGVMDFRRQHPGQAPYGAVLHGWSRSLQADVGRSSACRLRWFSSSTPP